MTPQEKNLLTILAIAAVLAPVALGAALGWPVWSWLLLAVPLLGVLGRVARSIQRRVRREQASVVPSIPAEQPEASQTSVADVALRSVVPDYDFLFSATACWRPALGSTVRHADLGGLATHAIVARAQAITAAEDPSRVDVVGHQLAAALGEVQRDASGVEAWAEQVQLTLPEADQARLRKHSDLRKDQDIWERERDHERSKRAYLADDVLKSSGSAVVWWLARHENNVKDALQLTKDLATLSDAANGKPLPNGPFHDGSHQATGFSGAGFPAGPFGNGRSVASLVGVLMDMLDLGDDRRALFARHGADLVEKAAGKPDEAAEIRRRFDAPAVAEESADVSEPDGEPRDWPTPDEQPPLPEEPWLNAQLEESDQDG
ncbi:MAG: hypothetical protein ACRD0K_02230 [Egibacteraceae bacterium]